MSDKQAFHIVGAGLVGSLLALRLSQEGHPVEVFEKREDMRTADISAGRSINLALANRGMEPLIAAGLKNEIKALTIPMRGRMIHHENGDTEFQSYGQRESEVIYSIGRGQLNQLLLNEAEKHGAKLKFNVDCKSVDLEQKTFKAKHFDEVSQIDFDCLIGTDGSNSPVRGALMDLPGSEFDLSPLDHSYKELCIPPTESGGWQIEREALHIWPRDSFMLIALPNLDGSFTVTLFMANSGDISFQALDTPEKVQVFFERFFPDALALLPSLMVDFFENPTGHLATVRCWPWNSEDKALILGDAAHAIVPFHGQGMNCGFEDVSCFMQQLQESGDSTTQAFTKTAELRKPNGDAIADLALENYVEMRADVRDPKYLLKKSIAFALEKKYPSRFVPRYSLVMFHHIPYAKAKSVGIKQDRFLSDLVKDIQTIEELDWQKVDEVMTQEFTENII